MRKRMRFVGVLAVLAAAAGTMFGVLSSRASAQGQAATQSVIVVFNNQDQAAPATRADLPSRESSFQGTQNPVVAQMTSAGATGIQAYSIIDAVSATVPSGEVATLQANPAVSEVIPNQLVPVSSPTSSAATGAAATTAGAAGPSADALVRRTSKAVRGRSLRPQETIGSGAVCSSSPSDPQLNPEALSLIHANSQVPGAQTAASLGITGAGVKVAFIADGLNPDNPDFIRPDGQKVFVDYKDFSGTGTNVPTGGEEAFGDASSIAAQGREVYNVQGYGPLATSKPCYIRIEGVAPGSSLVGLDVSGNDEDAFFTSSILNAINYAVTTDHVNVLNESFGGNEYPDDSAALDITKLANDAAVAAGTTVTVSSGDAGVTNTQGSPSTDPLVIAAGATTSYRLDLQDGYGGAQFPGIHGYLDNNISSLSSGGVNTQGSTVDIVAPGELNWALCTPLPSMYSECANAAGNPSSFIQFGGTSESAPLTAGVAALVDQAYEKTHGTYPTPAVVKQIIAGTADDIDSPGDQQGAGLVDAYQAVLAAESYKAPASAPAPQGETLLKSADQLNVVDQPNTPESLTDTVTNNGARTEHIAVSDRVLGGYTSVKNTTVTLSDTSSPSTENFEGTPANYEPVTFQVPAGQNRLNVAAAFITNQTDNTDAGLTARVRVTLVDPQGNLAGYSLPQGDGNYGDIQVTNPTAGPWTAYVWSNTSAAGGTQGPVQFGASVASYQSYGSVSPARLRLKPGQSAPVTLNFTTPATPGDYDGSLVFTGVGKSTGVLPTTTVPVTARTLIPSGNESFTQTLTGGNGRQVSTGEEFFYQLDVGANQPELNASVALANNPNNLFTAFLVGPNGEQQAVAANELLNGDSTTNTMGAELHVLNPAQGAWTLIVVFAPTVSGTALTEPFTVATSQTAVPVSSGGSLPDSASTQLTPGQATTVNVKVTNTGPAPEAFFPDGRLDSSTQLQLTALDGDTTSVPLNFSDNFPSYIVPTDSTGFVQTAITTGNEPIEFDSDSPAGDPDIESSSGMTATSTLAADPVTQGEWTMFPDVTGAYGTTGATPEPVTTQMFVTTAPFDPAISSPDGDLWDASTDPSALDSLSPTIVGPGQTGMIPVTITPQGKAGTVDTGTLYIDDEDSVLFDSYDEPSGNQVAAIPYEYTIK